MSDYCIVLITVPNTEEAGKIADGLVGERLAACVNIVPGITSVYWWEGAIQHDSECLLICKTQTALWESLTAWVKANHSYTVPELIQLPVQTGSDSYLDWIKSSLELTGSR